MRISISRNAKILAFAFCILGICCIVMEIWIYQDTNELSVVLSVFGGALIVYGIVLAILSIVNYVYIDNKKIALYYRNKLKNSIAIADVKRLLIWQINFHGAKNDCIIFDDGTFRIADFANNRTRSRKKTAEESWIVIEYSDRRFEEIKKVLKDCPIEIIKPDQY